MVRPAASAAGHRLFVSLFHGRFYFLSYQESGDQRDHSQYAANHERFGVVAVIV